MMTLANTQIGQLVAQFFLAGAGTLSFAILFACPRRTLPCCALVGAAGWFVYELAVLYGADAAAASLIAVIPLTLVSFFFAMIIAVAVALVLYANVPVLRQIARFYIWGIRGTPLLVQLFIIFHPRRKRPLAGQRHLHLQGRRRAGRGHRAGSGPAHAKGA